MPSVLNRHAVICGKRLKLLTEVLRSKPEHSQIDPDRLQASCGGH